MASSRNRQRKLARAKLDRQLARRAARRGAAGRSRPASAPPWSLVLIVAGSAWALGGVRLRPKQNTAAEDICLWTPQDATANTDLKDVGTPADQGPADRPAPGR